MIWPNEAARPYEFRFDLDSSYVRDTDDGGVEALCTESIKWGSVGEIKLTLRTWIDTGEPVVSPAINYEVTLETPWDADQTFTGSVWLGDSPVFTTLIQLDDVALAVEDCDAYDFEFSELRLLLAGVEEYTLGAQTDSNTGYDVRENRVVHTALPNPTPRPFGSEPVDLCPEDAFDLTVDIATTGGYRYGDGDGGWLYDLVAIEQYDPPSPPPVVGCDACDCQLDLDYPGLDPDRPEGTDSFYFQLTTQGHYRIVSELQGRFECGCDPPEATTLNGIWDVYFKYRRVRLPVMEGTVDPVGKGVTEHYRESGAACGCMPGDPPDYATDDETTDEAQSEARYEVSTYRIEQFKQCCDEIQTPLCFLDPGPPPPPPITQPDCYTCSGIDEDETLCVYEAYSKVEYPTEPPCVATVVSYDVSPSMRHARAVVDDSDELYVQVSSNVGPRLDWSGPVASGFTVSDATLRFLGGSGYLGLLYADAGAVEWRTTPDEGLTWSSAASVGSGERTALLYGRNAQVFQYWRDAGALKGRIVDNAGNVLVSTFTVIASGVDDAPIAADEDFSHALGWRVLLRFFMSGSLIERYSQDGETLV